MSIKVASIERTAGYLKKMPKNNIKSQRILENQGKVRKLAFIDEYPQCDERPELPDYDYDFYREEDSIVDKIGDKILGGLDKLVEFFEGKNK